MGRRSGMIYRSPRWRRRGAIACERLVDQFLRDALNLVPLAPEHLDCVLQRRRDPVQHLLRCSRCIPHPSYPPVGQAEGSHVPQNGFVESFNGRFRDECLNEHLFGSLPAARRIIEAWRSDYNTTRPHTSLNGLILAAFATRPASGQMENRLCS